MALTPEARGEIVEEAKRRALKDMGKSESELNGEEKRQAGSLANDYAVQMLKDAHDFKLRLADLDADKYAFEKVFASDLQNTPYAQNLNDDANLEEDFSSQVDENTRYNKNDTVWNDTPFDKQIDSYNEGTYQSGKLFTVGTPSELLKSKGIPEKKILMTEGVLKKIRKHGLSDGQIKKIPNAINNPIGIFSYPKNKNVFDILVEFHTDDGKPIIVSLEVNKNRQGFGEITDLLTAHPKESFGRIIDWAKKGRCIYWDKQKGRKLLQDTSPANRERYETELAPFLPLQSENFSENQEENAKYSKNFDEEEEIEGIFDKEEKREAKEINREKAKWTNRDGSMKEGYLKAPNGHPTSLAEKQWLLARTPSFKKKYGDWETLAIINEVKQMPASSVEIHKSLDKKGIKEAFKGFGEVTNNRDGRKVVFPSASAGKIHYHKGFPTNTIIKNFKSLFENSIPIISEKEEVIEGHKEHDNVENYNHYVNKFSIDGQEYYIRFTVPVIFNSKSASMVHSSAISEVSIYKNGDSSMAPQKTADNSRPTFVDEKLADFLNSVNEKDVKIYLDKNGEPIMSDFGLPQVKESEPLVFKPILKPKLPLPKRFREGKVAGIGDIRRWVSEAMGINVNLEADAGADYNGVYTTPSDTIHLRSDNINSPGVLFHELGHSIEKRFFNDYFSDNQNHPASRELFEYFKKQKNAEAYKKSEYVSEGFAEFIKEFVLNPGSVAKEFQRGLH